MREGVEVLMQVHRIGVGGSRLSLGVRLLAALALLGGGASLAAAEPPAQESAPAPPARAQAVAAEAVGAPQGLPAAAATDRAAALAMEDALALDEAEAAQRNAGPSPAMELRAQAAEARFAAALAAAPGDAALAGDVNGFYSRWGHLLLAVDRAMLAVVEGAPDPALLALRLAVDRSADHGPCPPARPGHLDPRWQRRHPVARAAAGRLAHRGALAVVQLSAGLAPG